MAYRGLGRVDYVRAKYAEQGIDTDNTKQSGTSFDAEIWWNAISIPPEKMSDHVCQMCISDCDWFNPQIHTLEKYETRPYIPPKEGEKRPPKIPPGTHVLCCRSCLWWDWASERRRQKLKNASKHKRNSGLE